MELTPFLMNQPLMQGQSPSGWLVTRDVDSLLRKNYLLLRVAPHDQAWNKHWSIRWPTRWDDDGAPTSWGAGNDFLDAEQSDFYLTLNELYDTPEVSAVRPLFSTITVTDFLGAYLVNQDHTTLGIRAGDVIYWMKNRESVNSLTGLCPRLFVPAREDYPSLQQWYREGTTVVSPLHPEWRSPREILGMQSRWGQSGSNWWPRLAVARPVTPSETFTIRASSDEAAIFELLGQVGGRMPTPNPIQ